MQAKSILILGGARSGKSEYAETICEQSSDKLLYIATSPIFKSDAEMQQRIALHKQRRGDKWTLVEEQTQLARIIQTHDQPDQIILVDCLTLWLSNLMFHEHDLTEAKEALAKTLANLQGRIIFISNEVGQGIVPENKLSRHFRDEQGRLNQFMAQQADQVIEVKYGLPQQLKPAPIPVPFKI